MPGIKREQFKPLKRTQHRRDVGMGAMNRDHPASVSGAEGRMQRKPSMRSEFKTRNGPEGKTY